MDIISKDQAIMKISRVERIKYNKGGLWDFNEIEIATNYPIYERIKLLVII